MDPLRGDFFIHDYSESFCPPGLLNYFEGFPVYGEFFLENSSYLPAKSINQENLQQLAAHRATSAKVLDRLLKKVFRDDLPGKEHLAHYNDLLQLAGLPMIPMMLQPLTLTQLILWASSVAFLGIFFAVPLRRQMIIVEQLRYPSGTAAGETIRAMYASGKEALAKARVLLWAAIFAGVWKVIFSLKFLP